MDVVASISDRVGDLGGYLREQREHARLSLRQLAQLAGVSNPYLSQVERGLRNPSAEVLQQIARGLRISAEALYVRAGILESEQQRPDVEAAVHADPDLSDRQKHVLLDIYSAFRTENARIAADPAESAESAPAPRRRSTKRTASAPVAEARPSVKAARRPRRTAKSSPAAGSPEVVASASRPPGATTSTTSTPTRRPRRKRDADGDTSTPTTATPKTSTPTTATPKTSTDD
jgi:transcriptional regulator with XRE-family HTH domain